MRLVLAAVLALAASTALAAEDNPYRLDNPDYWKSYVDNAGRVIATPFATSGDVDWTRNALILGAVAGAYLLDDKVQRFAHSHRNSTTDGISKGAEPFGALYLLGPGLIGAYGYGRYGDDPKLQETALLGAESLIIAGAFAEGIKRTVGRDRPNEPEERHDKQDFNGPHKGKDGSFPSGHTTAAFSVASVVASEYRETPAVGLTAYGIATLTGLSRINDQEHWLSDVLAGAALGTGVGLLVYHFRPFGPDGQTVSVSPGAGQRPAGLTLTARF
ncbi:MAG: phosphatase PAP2 family protein [Alphaproteobacteria bacterium]|nr:phosphatase PAP2 family protein [Alphaproteobacteria bacterium]